MVGQGRGVQTRGVKIDGGEEEKREKMRGERYSIHLYSIRTGLTEHEGNKFTIRTIMTGKGEHE